MKLLTTLILLLVCQSANAWQWRITERANCANGQCTATIRESLTVQPQQKSIKFDTLLTDCPDGRCPLLPRLAHVPSVQGATSPVCEGGLCHLPSAGGLKRLPTVTAWRNSGFNQPTLAPPEPRVIVQAKPLRSVMVQPVRRVRVFSGRIVQRIFGRR